MNSDRIEREVLIRNAPHLTRPLRFVLPYHSGLRPAWMLITRGNSPLISGTPIPRGSVLWAITTEAT